MGFKNYTADLSFCVKITLNCCFSEVEPDLNFLSANTDGSF